jgi:hypothetical protein
VGPRTGLDDIEKRKFLTLPGLELRPIVIQPAASRYTDCAIATPKLCVRWCSVAAVREIRRLQSAQTADKSDRHYMKRNYIIAECGKADTENATQ